MPVSLLLTRPEVQSARFAEECRARFGPDIPIVISPVLGIRFRNVPVDLQGLGGVVFTSENAVAAGGWDAVPPGLAAWCVGDRTAAAAERAGFAARSAAGDAAALVALLARQRLKGPLLHLRGAHSRGALPQKLAALGHVVRDQILYDQVELPLNDAARALLRAPGLVILPLFSPRSATVLVGQTGLGAAQLGPVAISPAAAAAWKAVRPGTVPVAARPDANAMLAACESLIAQAGAG